MHASLCFWIVFSAFSLNLEWMMVNSDLACSDVQILSVILANMHGDAVLLESISGSIVVASLLDSEGSVFFSSFFFGLELN